MSTFDLVEVPEEGLDIVFDCELMRPGCVLLQAAFSCLPSVSRAFPVESWLVYPTPGLKKYHIDNQHQLEVLAFKVEQRMKNESSRKT